MKDPNREFELSVLSGTPSSRTKPIPYYEEPGITIYHGDCRDILPHLEPMDLVLTDPPYGLGEKLRSGITGMMGGCFNEMVDSGWDVRPDKQTFKLILEKARDYIIWGGNYFCEYLRGSQCFLVWDKMNGTNPMADCELALTSLDGGARMFSLHHFSSGYGNKLHPTQKPLPLIKWCLSFTPNAQAILDPFMGSGTTLRAAKDLGRKCIGIEIEEKYCAIAIERLRQGVLL
jgi:DNA modification methylase